MLTKAVSILLFVLSSLVTKATTADTLVVIFDRQNFVQGDSIEIEIYTEPYRSDPSAQTLHLWIDNVKTGQRWKYRYPFLKGRYKIGLKISDSIPNGTYAFNFLLQNKFLAVKGKFKNAGDDDKAVNYIAISKNKVPIIDEAELESDGSFKIDDLFYTDSVYFGFSPVKKSKENPLRIAIETPIDSAFVSETSTTEFITVGRRPPGAGTTVPLHHAPGPGQRARANQRRRASRAQAQEPLARRHHPPRDVAAGVHAATGGAGTQTEGCT